MLVKVARLSELPVNSLTEVTLGGETFALCNVDGRVRALSGICLHRGGPLGQGALHGDRVVCPWHAWEWECETGASEFNPSQKVATFRVQVEGDDILLDVPDRA